MIVIRKNSEMVSTCRIDSRFKSEGRCQGGDRVTGRWSRGWWRRRWLRRRCCGRISSCCNSLLLRYKGRRRGRAADTWTVEVLKGDDRSVDSSEFRVLGAVSGERDGNGWVVDCMASIDIRVEGLK